MREDLVFYVLEVNVPIVGRPGAEATSEVNSVNIVLAENLLYNTNSLL